MDNNNNNFNPIDNNDTQSSDNGKGQGHTGWAIVVMIIILAFLGLTAWGVTRLIGIIF